MRALDPVRLLAGAGTAALALMLLCIVGDVGMRLAFKRPFNGAIDIVEATLVLVAFLALPACFRGDEQIKVDVFDRVVSPRTLAGMRLVGELATLAFLALLAASVVSPLVDAYRFGDVKADFPIPIAALLLAIEVALILSALVVLLRVVAQLRSPARQATAHHGGAAETVPPERRSERPPA